MAEIAEEKYTTPLAKWSRILEIFIPGYMFGKAWGIANEHTVELYRVIFPPFLIDMAEYMKTLVAITNPSLGRFYSTSAGAVVGFAVILLLGLVMHLVLRDRKYIDSLRFTSITLIPLAVMHGTLTHVTNTIFESLGGGETIEALTKAANAVAAAVADSCMNRRRDIIGLFFPGIFFSTEGPNSVASRRGNAVGYLHLAGDGES